VHDVARDGRLLLSRDTFRSEVFGRIDSEKDERELGWLDNSFATDLTLNGGMILLSVQGEATASGTKSISARLTDHLQCTWEMVSP
jgi:hypothetical protein